MEGLGFSRLRIKNVTFKQYWAAQSFLISKIKEFRKSVFIAHA